MIKLANKLIVKNLNITFVMKMLEIKTAVSLTSCKDYMNKL